VRRRVVALLAVARLLRLALAHGARRGRADDEQVEQRGDEDGGEGVEDRGAVFGGENAGEGGGQEGRCGRVGQCDENGEGSLQREVDGEEALLEGGELGAREGAEGDDAADERLRGWQVLAWKSEGNGGGHGELEGRKVMDRLCWNLGRWCPRGRIRLDRTYLPELAAEQSTIPARCQSQGKQKRTALVRLTR
jgi:hypothetical protein